ncbi:MAG: hypothetical protein R2728_16110 [Chitinophagales bacterium]
MHETKNLLFALGMFCLLVCLPQAVNAQCPGFSIINASATDVVCKGDNNGRITVLVNNTGATILTSYIQPGPPPSGQMQATSIGGNQVFVDTFYNLAAGVYDVIVGDETLCTDTIKVTVSEPSSPFTVLFDSTRDASCGNNGYLAASTTGGWSNPTVFVWDGYDPMGQQINGFPKQLGFQLTTLTAGTYTVTATDSRGCKDDSTITLVGGSIFEVDITSFNNTLPMPLGDSIDLVATPNSAGNITYSWFPLRDLESISLLGDTVRVKPCVERSYIVLAIDQDRQCSDVDSIRITLDGSFAPWLPNIFDPTDPSPDRSEFKAFGKGIVEVDLEIFDRKGAIVYETPDSVALGSWNGKFGNTGSDLVAGKYLFISRIKSICGEIISKSGGITLLR